MLKDNLYIPTLYKQLKDIERVYKNFEEKGLSHQFPIISTQQSLLQKYEENPIFLEAIQKRKTIEENLAELSQVNRHIFQLLPRRKNKLHNERVEQMGELISSTYQLKTRGIFAFDNAVNGVIVGGLIGYLGIHVLAWLFGQGEDPSVVKSNTDKILPFATFLSAACGGSMEHGAKRRGDLPFKEAKYLDEKIKEFY